MTRGLRYLLPLLAAALLGFLALNAIGRRPAAPGIPVVGRTLPSFDLRLLGGGEVTADELLGKPTFINFWASWCGPCQMEMPFIEEIYQKEKAKLNILGINMQEPEIVADEFVRTNGYTFPMALDLNGDLHAGWGFNGLPVSIFTDRRGTVCRIHMGGMTRSMMRAAVDEALAGCS